MHFAAEAFSGRLIQRMNLYLYMEKKIRVTKGVKVMNQTVRTVRRGDVYLADLDPAIGCEQGGIRPVLVLQNDIGNLYSPTTIVAAVTAKQTKKALPVHMPISSYMLRTDSTLLLEQIRTIDKCRLQAYLGSINQKEMRDIDRALKLSIGLIPPAAVRKKYSKKYI